MLLVYKYISLRIYRAPVQAGVEIIFPKEWRGGGGQKTTWPSWASRSTWWSCVSSDEFEFYKLVTKQMYTHTHILCWKEHAFALSQQQPYTGLYIVHFNLWYIWEYGSRQVLGRGGGGVFVTSISKFQEGRPEEFASCYNLNIVSLICLFRKIKFIFKYLIFFLNNSCW